MSAPERKSASGEENVSFDEQARVRYEEVEILVGKHLPIHLIHFEDTLQTRHRIPRAAIGVMEVDGLPFVFRAEHTYPQGRLIPYVKSHESGRMTTWSMHQPYVPVSFQAEDTPSRKLFTPFAQPIFIQPLGREHMAWMLKKLGENIADADPLVPQLRVALQTREEDYSRFFEEYKTYGYSNLSEEEKTQEQKEKEAKRAKISAMVFVGINKQYATWLKEMTVKYGEQLEATQKGV